MPIDSQPTESGVSPTDRNNAPMHLAERKPSLMSLRAEEVRAPQVSAERALELSTQLQGLARDLSGPFPFQADFFDEVKRLAQSTLLDDALAFFAAEGALVAPGLLLDAGAVGSSDDDLAEPSAANDLWRRAYTFWVIGYDKVVRVGRFYAEAPETWPDLQVGTRSPSTAP